MKVGNFQNEISSMVEDNMNNPMVILSAFADYEFCNLSGNNIRPLSFEDNLKRSRYLELKIQSSGYNYYEIHYNTNNDFFIDYAVIPGVNTNKRDFMNSILTLTMELNQKNFIYLPKGSLYGWYENYSAPKLVLLDNCNYAKSFKVKEIFSLQYTIFDSSMLSEILKMKNNRGTKHDNFDPELRLIVINKVAGIRYKNSNFNKKDWRDIKIYDDYDKTDTVNYNNGNNNIAHGF